MSTALILFAKAPVAGQAKTRLMPALGAEGAAQLAGRMLDHAVRQAHGVQAEYLELCVTPTDQHPAFKQAQACTAGQLHLTLQGEGDLGDRMARSLHRALAVHSKALLMGTDAPALTASLIHQACEALTSHDAVFVPTHDGGYALIGLRKPAPALFKGMAWSTPTVMQDTRERARTAGLRWHELPPIADIDEPADLCHVPEGWL